MNRPLASTRGPQPPIAVASVAGSAQLAAPGLGAGNVALGAMPAPLAAPAVRKDRLGFKVASFFAPDLVGGGWATPVGSIGPNGAGRGRPAPPATAPANQPAAHLAGPEPPPQGPPSSVADIAPALLLSPPAFAAAAAAAAVATAATQPSASITCSGAWPAATLDTATRLPATFESLYADSSGAALEPATRRSATFLDSSNPLADESAKRRLHELSQETAAAAAGAGAERDVAGRDGDTETEEEDDGDDEVGGLGGLLAVREIESVGLNSTGFHTQAYGGCQRLGLDLAALFPSLDDDDFV